MKNTPQTTYNDLLKRLGNWQTQFVARKNRPLTGEEARLLKYVKHFVATVGYLKQGLDVPYQTLTIAMDVTNKYLEGEMTAEAYKQYAEDMKSPLPLFEAAQQEGPSILSLSLRYASWALFAVSITAMIVGGPTGLILGVLGIFCSYFMGDISRLNASNYGKVTTDMNLGETMEDIGSLAPSI